MPASADIYGQIQPFKAPNPLADMAQVMQIKGAMNQDAASQYTLRKSQRQDEETNALSALLKTPGFDLSSADGQRQAYGVAPTVAPTYIKNQLDAKKTQSDIGKSDAETGKFKMDTHAKQVELSGQVFGALRTNPTPENFAAKMDQLQQYGIMPAEMVAQIKAKAAADPTTIPGMVEDGFRAALSAKDQLPQFHQVDTGGGVQVGGVDPVTAKFTPTATLGKTATPGEVLSANTSRANNRDTIAAENMRAGVVPGGGMDDNSERTAQAIASGQLPAPTGMALLNPKNQRILGRVMEINPQYDATTVSAKKKAAADFTSGPLGNALRSVSTANAHLDQLGELADALQNGNTEVINKVGNYFSKQTGNPAVTNFDAIKNIVGQEVVKAIVAGGGGVGEREEAAKIFSSANSPAQLKGAIQHYRMVMGAQANNLIEQRRAAGLPDSTLPNYAGTNTTPAAPATAGAAPKGWTYIGTTK